MNTRIIVYSLAVCLMGLGACGSKTTPAPVTTSDLTLTDSISTDGSGLVAFRATATNVLYYTYFFGDSSSVSHQSADGYIKHSYSVSGSYNVQVIATLKDNSNADKSITLNVERSPNYGSTAIPTKGYTTPEQYDGMTLLWQDEFSGTELNTADWNYETGGGGWGNAELEYYQASNTTVGDGYLVITARHENVGGSSYTSSRITTQNKHTFTYGRVDIRAVLPKGTGLWPALWMLGSSISTVAWPACGEVDIMELIGGAGKDNTVYGTAHWDNSGHQQSGGNTSLQDSVFADKFHVFSIIWNSTSITWLVDDQSYFTTNITSDATSELRAPFFFIFNVAVGGAWPGNPNSSTVFPQHMVVDYIRVFQ